MKGTSLSDFGSTDGIVDWVMRPACDADFASLCALLHQARLPTEDLASAEGLRLWVLASRDEEIQGVVGLELAGDAGLLRSFTIAERRRGEGLGRLLIEYLEQRAKALDVRQLMLLTEGAESYFSRLGYRVIDRRQAPETLQRSAQFRSICPASAVCMTKWLETKGG